MAGSETDAQRSSRRHRLLEMDSASRVAETPSSDNLIDIDVETELRHNVDREGQGGGSGNGMGATDDEDLMTSGSGSGDSMPDLRDVDRPPTANAGPDIILHLPQNRVTLCGNGSYDDRGIVSYYWIKKSTQLLSADMVGVRAVCVELSNLQVGDYIFTLVVTDSGGNKATSDVNVIVKPGASPDPATPCQQLRETSRHVYGTFVPRCTEQGNYDSLQCRGHRGTSTCWCADLDGREIPGTAKSPPQIPDCEEGTNLPPCVFMLVGQLRGRMLGAFKPKCTLDGFFQTKQCSGSMCYCVHTGSGVKIPNTEVIVPDQPICDGSRVKTPGKDQKVTMPPPEPQTPVREPEITTKVNVIIENKGGKPTTKKPAVSNDSKGSKGDVMSRPPSSAAHIMTQPGILAAIIGGSVVLLLCAVLLVMFVVYRMRKKDEGSYALDEPKKMPNYSYQRAPDKEFYA